MMNATPDIDIGELRKLLDVAAEAPWMVIEDNVRGEHRWTIWDASGNVFVLDMIRPLDGDLKFNWVQQRTDNFAAICALRNAAPALLAAYEEWNSEDGPNAQVRHYKHACDKLDAENFALKSRLAAADAVVSAATTLRDEIRSSGTHQTWKGVNNALSTYEGKSE